MLKDLKVAIEGNEDGPTLVFLHGYPDDFTLWQSQVDSLKEDFYCIRIQLPNSGDHVDAPFGVSFSKMADLIKNILMENLKNNQKTVTMVCHDWGSMYGMVFINKYPKLVDKVTVVDVGWSLGKQKNLIGYFLLPWYQSNLAMAFCMAQIPKIGEPVASVWTKTVLKALHFAGTTCQSDKNANTKGPKRKHDMSAYQNYPYLYFWLERYFFPKNFKMKLKDTPILFVYGKQGIKGAVDFHDDRWLRIVNSNPDGKVVCFEEAGHWVMRDNPEEFNRELREFAT